MSCDWKSTTRPDKGRVRFALVAVVLLPVSCVMRPKEKDNAAASEHSSENFTKNDKVFPGHDDQKKMCLSDGIQERTTGLFVGLRCYDFLVLD
jgi:hypothetical protein